MLTFARIQNFRSCRDVQLEHMGGVVALVGRNGAGKSNVLQAIGSIARLATSNEAIHYALIRSIAHDDDAFSIEFQFETQGAIYRYNLSVSAIKEPPEKTLLWEDLDIIGPGGVTNLFRRQAGRLNLNRLDGEIGVVIGEFSPSLASISGLFPSDELTLKHIGPVTKFLSAIRYYPLDEPAGGGMFSGPFRAQQYNTWVSSYEAAGALNGSDDGEALLYRIIYMALKRSDDFAALKSLMGNDGLCLLDSIEVDPVDIKLTSRDSGAAENIYYFVRFSPSRGVSAKPIDIDYENLSVGTRRVLRMMVATLFDRSSVLLLEQPEDSLHQGLTKNIIGILRQNAHPAQLIFSTHSSALLNQLDPSEIRLISMHDGFTVAKPLTSQQIQIAEKFMNDQGPLYDFLEMIQED